MDTIRIVGGNVKKNYLIPCICIFVVSVIIIALMTGKKAFKNLESTDVISSTVRLLPPDKTFQIKDTDELVKILNGVVVYYKDNSYNEYAGQANVYTLFMADGSKKEIIECSPFIVVDGIGYRAKHKSCIFLDTIANRAKYEVSGEP